MWRKMMRTWLVGAAVTMAAPGGAVRAESIAPPEDGVKNCESDAGRGSGSVPSSSWSEGEPLLSDLLADPIVGMLMRSDGVTRPSLTALMDAVRTSITTPTNSAPADGEFGNNKTDLG